MAVPYTAATININGMRDSKKREPFFLWLKSLPINIIFIQETHCSKSDIEQWSIEWDGHALWSPGTRQSKGVAVLFNFQFEYVIKNEIIDLNGRYIYFDLKINEDVFNFTNIYAPNNPVTRVAFFKNLKDKCIVTDDNLIGGDYNCTLNHKLDRYNCRSQREDTGTVELKSLITECKLEDYWRRRYPNKRSYSWARGNKKSRIDYWLTSQSLNDKIDHVDYKACPFSDHDMAIIQINTSKEPLGPGTWKMNASVIKSELFKTCFTNFWKEWKEEKINFNDLSLWWDIGKKKIKEITIWCSIKLKQDRANQRRIIERNIDIMKNNEHCNTDDIEKEELKLRKLIEKEAEGIKIRSRVKWFEEGEKSTKFFHSVEKTKAKQKNWNKILDEKKNTKIGTTEIMEVQRNFYENLYRSEGIDKSACEFFGQFINKKITDNSHEIMNKKINLNDFTKVLKKVDSDSSPGPDGIIFLFYQIYWDYLKEDFLEVFENCYRTNELTYSQYLALIILLYKKGIREDIENWRPISLGNTDIKLLTKVFAERMKLVLPDIIDEDQSGCVKNRKIGYSIRMIEDTHNEMDENNIILLTDKRKAFDLIEWEWLFFVLEKYGFGSYFINWLKIIYSGMQSAILTNGYISPYFRLTRGIRQGDALSALLYIIQAEPLAECIRCSDRIRGINISDIHGNTQESKGTQYVDDSTNMLKNSSYIDICIGIIDHFGDASGSRINRSKTIALISEHHQDGRNIKTVNKIDVQKNVEKSLGVPVGKGPVFSKFWNSKVEKIKTKLDFWRMRDLSLIGKVHIVKSVIIPIVQYGAAHIEIPNEVVKSIQELIWKFVWKWGTCLVKRDVLYIPRQQGGLGIPSFETIIKTARIKLTIDIMKGPQKWNFIARKHLLSFDATFGTEAFIFISNYCHDFITELINSSSVPKFYKECMLAFLELNKKGRIENNKDIFLWKNKSIRFQRHSLYFSHWAEVGLNYLSDIVTNGNLDQNKIMSKVRRKKGNVIFDISKLNNALRNIDKTNVMPQTKTFNDMNYKIPGTKVTRNVFDLTSKEIYNILSDNCVEIKSKQYWQDKFQNVHFDFDIWFSNLFMSRIMPNKVLDFNWRIFHGQILTEKRLVSMNMSNGMCVVCKKEIEDNFHLFVHCEDVLYIWKFVEKITNVIECKK